MEAFPLASTPLFAAGKRGDKIETPFQGAALQHLQLKGFQSHFLGTGYAAKALRESRKQHHCNSRGSAKTIVRCSSWKAKK